MRENFVPRIHRKLQRRYNVTIDNDEIAISSLIFTLNFLGIKSNMSCGGHYEELDEFTQSNRWMYGRGGAFYPWINFSYNSVNNFLLGGIEKIAEEKTD